MTPMTNDHVPVLYTEVLDILRPVRGDCFIDGTLGSGGHAYGLLEATAPDGVVFGFDRDSDAIERTQAYLSAFSERLVTIHDSYHRIDLYTKSYERCIGISGVLLDLGYSSPQIDDPERGLSFRADGPLDMRFDRSKGQTAADIVNFSSETDLANLIYEYGEERHSRRIARRLVKQRPFQRTLALANAIRAAVPNKHNSRIDPATRTFQALRIATNDELEILKEALPRALSVLQSGGRLAVISFHSLEDRIVKQWMKAEAADFIRDPTHPMGGVDREPTLEILTHKPITATEAEVATNLRSRSAKLRIAQKR